MSFLVGYSKHQSVRLITLMSPAPSLARKLTSPSPPSATIKQYQTHRRSCSQHLAAWTSLLTMLVECVTRTSQRTVNQHLLTKAVSTEPESSTPNTWELHPLKSISPNKSVNQPISIARSSLSLQALVKFPTLLDLTHASGAILS